MPDANPENLTAPDSGPSMSAALDAFREAGLDPSDSSPAPSPAPSAPAPSAPSSSSAAPAPPQAAPQRVDAFTPRENGHQPDPNSRAARLAAITDPEDRERLLRMSNAAFERFYPIALQLQAGDLVPKTKIDEMIGQREAAIRAELETKLGATRWADHEEGYRLSPEFRAAETNLQNMEAQQDFWQDQLGLLRAGTPFQILEETKDGVRVSQQKYDPKDPSAEGFLLAKLTQTSSRAEFWRDKLKTFPETHKAHYTQFSGKLADLDSQLFKAVTNPTFSKAVTENLQQWPASLRGRPEIALICKMQVAGDLLLRRIAQLEKQQAARTNSVAATTAAAPNPLDTGAATDGASDTAAAVAELDRIASSRY